ncbi:MAG: RNA-binding protein [Flavobacteriales bacterium]|nr:RNA-binding protein [Flavobacteriales bacterium]
MSHKLFIGNCSFNLDETTLESFMNSNGIEVTSVQIIRDRDTGRSRGFGFAELADASQLRHAIETLNGKEVEGRALTVNEAREKSKSDNNHRGGGRGGRNSYSDRW